jgi:hypothetical protein
MKLCPPETPLPTQPGATAGWKYSNNAYGTYASKKTRHNTARSHGWTVPSTLLGGMTLQAWRRGWLSYCAWAWNNNPGLNKASFTANAGGYTLYNLEGTPITPTPWNVYMWAATVQWGALAFLNYQAGIPRYQSLDLSCNTPQTVVAPPTITAAALATDMTLTLTIGDAAPSGSSYLNVYTGTPFTYGARLPALLACRVFALFGAGPHSVTVSSADMLDLFKPFPKGANALVGCRWVFGYNCHNSQAAAELVEVGA